MSISEARESASIPRARTLPPALGEAPDQPPSLSGVTSPGAWLGRYGRRLVLTDLAVVVLAVASAHAYRFGLDDGPVTGGSALGYVELSVLIGVAWLGSLTLHDTRDLKVVGTGADEYKRVLNASWRLFGLVAIGAFLFRLDIARTYVAVAFPIGTLLLLLSRYGWRHWLYARRRAGGYTSRVLVVGGAGTSADLTSALARHPLAGYRVVGACVPGLAAGEQLPGTDVPVVGPPERAAALAAAVRADAVAVTTSEAFGTQELRRLAWALEGSGISLAVAPGLTDVAGPRVHTRPVAGLPLLHVEEPQYEGAARVGKRVFDMVVAAAALIVLSPVIAVIAVLVRLTSPGPVLFRQERVGVRGEPFVMLKFRSMHVDAEQRLDALLAKSDSNNVLFKLKNDPRVTSVGKHLRRYSLDELPQLVNVLCGDMSLVGPRPPIQREVDLYHDHVHRRLLVKPGITGLWQVSGRSDLSWEDAVRLDLYYVENWSMTADLQILWRTVRTVLGAKGAY
ncbi:sugar transferase [Motilibacter deserti]|uniref:Sugar transferase n=1 Tax=Motilibacter deserti TaxID=2714956 RepID=A0ABX0GUV4_9ACTN|nr:sugar transferase [Motilibacter deserti]NHC13430.1 sugar transferase [Motilibacter deserti]